MSAPDPTVPPATPPDGCWSPLLWDLARQVLIDHRPALDGHCMLCRPPEPVPCQPRRLATTMLNLCADQVGREIIITTQGVMPPASPPHARHAGSSPPDVISHPNGLDRVGSRSW